MNVRGRQQGEGFSLSVSEEMDIAQIRPFDYPDIGLRQRTRDSHSDRKFLLLRSLYASLTKDFIVLAARKASVTAEFAR